MIKVRGMDGKEFILNCDLIERIEEVPDTVITVTSDRKYIIEESVDEVIKKVIEYKRSIYAITEK